MIPTNINIERIKGNLKQKGKLLSINDNDSCLAVACFLHDLSRDFSTVIEEKEDEIYCDPLLPQSEQQLTDLHRLFRSEMRKRPFCFSNTEGMIFERHIMALSCILLKVCIVRAYDKINESKKKEQH